MRYVAFAMYYHCSQMDEFRHEVHHTLIQTSEGRKKDKCERKIVLFIIMSESLGFDLVCDNITLSIYILRYRCSLIIRCDIGQV